MRKAEFVLGQHELYNEFEELIKSMKKNQIQEVEIEKNGTSSKFLLKLINIQVPHTNEWDIENDEERAENANQLKLKGNKYLKEQKYEDAKNVYFSAASSIENDSGDLFEDVKLNLNQNLILAYLKSKEFDKSKALADKLLAENPNNIKVLYRRALSFMGLGDFENAKKDLSLALTIEPNNQDVINELTNIKEKQKVHKEKERAIFGKMFGN